ncbi:putative Fungal N-terminal domain-containing protein [Seiridium cardinale]|uniref:Fungal N-terminal domain-containing protein n=1 Tax=Seiridium cardinale TaxID=138064 RepID=A0ABR2XRN0_9PEZI
MNFLKLCHYRKPVSIGTLAKATFNVARAIYVLADEVSTAIRQIRRLAPETESLAIFLSLLQYRLAPPRRVLERAWTVVKEIIGVFADEIEDLQQGLQLLMVSEGKEISLTPKDDMDIHAVTSILEAGIPGFFEALEALDYDSFTNSTDRAFNART